MKKLIIFCLIFAAPLLHASNEAVLESITCQTRDGYTVDVWFNSIGGKGTGGKRIPNFTVRQNGQVIGSVFNPITLVGEEYDTFLNAYVWAFVSNDETAMIGVGLPNQGGLQPGTYDFAKADLFIEIEGHYIDDTTVPCTVVLK